MKGMDEHELNDVTDQLDVDISEATEAFHPKLTLTSKRMHNRRRGVNFRRVYIGMIDFAGDQSPELGGISVGAEGGRLVPASDIPDGLQVEKGDDGFKIQGRAEDGRPYAVFDLFPDGKSQAAKVTAENEGCDPVEARFEFTPPPLHWLFDVTESLVWAFFIAMLIRIFLFQTFFIPSGSMQPTLFKGDRIVANKLIYKFRLPRRGEVVIFKVYSYTSEEELRKALPEQLLVMGRPSFKKNDRLGERFIKRDYIKRVAGLPGDEIEIRDQQLIVNGERVDEPWITNPIYDFKYEYGPIVVPEGQLFVLGDNHNNSQDSHKLGFLPLENVVGKAMFVFYPTNNIKLIK